MPPRPLTQFEKPIVDAVVSMGVCQGWEFAAYLETSKGPLIEIRTLMRRDGADPSVDVLQKAGNGKLVCHHNHLSQESLSSADWRGLAQIFDETWAHCEDGTQYYGRVIDICNVERILRTNYEAVESSAETKLFKILNAKNNPRATDLAGLFRKDVLNRAMCEREMVVYDVSWGTKNIPSCAVQNFPKLLNPVGSYGTSLIKDIDEAAKIVAATL